MLKVLSVLVLGLVLAVPSLAKEGADDNTGALPDVRHEDRQEDRQQDRQQDRQLEQEIRGQENEPERHGVLEGERKGMDEMEAEHQHRGRDRDRDRDRDMNMKNSQNELQKLESELRNNEIETETINNAKDDYNELRKNGFTPGSSRSIVAKTVLEAHKEGLRGTALAERVKMAIRERIEQRKSEKPEKTEKKIEKERPEVEKNKYK